MNRDKIILYTAAGLAAAVGIANAFVCVYMWQEPNWPRFVFGVLLVLVLAAETVWLVQLGRDS